MLRNILVIAAALAAPLCFAQENLPAQQKPEVKVHMVNACSPSPDEQRELAEALEHVPRKPAFSEDFEVDRGRSVLDQNASPLAMIGQSTSVQSGENAVADFVRVRRDINGTGMYSTVQYSFSRDAEQMVETLVFRVREPKDLLQLSIEDNASTVTPAATMLGAATPASRIKLERFGKSSVILARCVASPDGPVPDQSKYEPLFTAASSVLLHYRGLLQAKTLIPEELGRIRRTSAMPAPSAKRGTSQTAAAKHP